ncbi:hypothetical protein B0H16DRAFT_1748636 [Mycena metata]|uniref:Uncharacterized protein n=1 Tax=Mycena metata TaxID=1033252 RepID=A0AAD7GQY2_9AGAR|nr:hypothetical protein B0H16DRAFT_1748636 [Mycena metata]
MERFRRTLLPLPLWPVPAPTPSSSFRTPTSMRLSTARARSHLPKRGLGPGDGPPRAVTGVKSLLNTSPAHASSHSSHIDNTMEEQGEGTGAERGAGDQEQLVAHPAAAADDASRFGCVFPYACLLL